MVCAGSAREKPILVTDAHRATVTIVAHGAQPQIPHFVLKYSGACMGVWGGVGVVGWVGGWVGVGVAGGVGG